MNGIERAVHGLLEESPRLKNLVVVTYQTACSVLPYEERVPSATRHERHFFGFHDKCPWHQGGRLALAHRFEEGVRPTRDAVEVGVLEPGAEGSFVPLGRTGAWNWQQGAELQWVGPSDRVLYNVLTGGRARSVLAELDGTTSTLGAPVSAVSPDGRQAASFDFGRLAVGMPGYGYGAADIGSPGAPALTLLDLASGQESVVFAVAEERAGSAFLSHTTFSPSGARLAFFERMPARRRTLSTTMRVADLSTGEVHRLSLHDVSHYAWIDDTHLIAHCRAVPEAGWAYHIVDLAAGSAPPVAWLAGLPDGHPGTCEAHELIVSDTYPDRRRLQRLLVMDPESRTTHELARLRIPMRFRGVERCDFHPRWSRDGTKICFDSAHTGVRSLYFMNYPARPGERPA